MVSQSHLPVADVSAICLSKSRVTHVLSVLQIHFAEEWNELHHLQIMESLGGDQYWIDRFAAQHAAVFYYWVLVFFFAFSPELAYIFSELVEVRCHPCCPSKGVADPCESYRVLCRREPIIWQSQ